MSSFLIGFIIGGAIGGFIGLFMGGVAVVSERERIYRELFNKGIVGGEHEQQAKEEE